MAKLLPGDPPQATRPDPDLDAVRDFVAEVALVAGSIDPMLAVILGGGLEPVPQRKRWTKGRRNGLEFCLVMLGYARSEAGGGAESQRIERAISYIVLEFARLHHVPQQTAAS